MKFVYAADSDLFLAVERDNAPAKRLAEFHERHVLDIDRAAAMALQNDSLDIFDRLDLPEASHHQLFRASLDQAGAHVLIVLADGLDNLIDGQVVFEKVLRHHAHLVLANVAALAEHLGDARDGLEVPFDDPVLERSQLGGAVAGSVDVVSQNFAHPADDRSLLNSVRQVDALRDAVFGHLEPLVHLLVREVDIHVVLEIDVYGGQAVAGQRAYLLNARDAHHGYLDRTGDKLLHFLGCDAFGLREDLHEVGADIRKGVNGQVHKRINACPAHTNEQQKHQ